MKLLSIYGKRKEKHVTASLPELDMTKTKEEMSLFHTFHHLNSNALVTA